MTYPTDPTTPTTSTIDRGVRTLVHAHQLAFTGSGIVSAVVLAVIFVAIGTLLLWACRAGWKRLG